MQQWDGVGEFLLEEAAADLEEGGDIRPCLVAFRGDEALFVAFLRSFDKGAYAEPIIELLALAAPLHADRLALSLGGRAWSLDDPIPPVLAGEGDLRQRVLCILSVDGTTGDASVTSGVHPFTIDGGRVVWEEAVSAGGGEGWVVSALALAVTCRELRGACERDVRRQARRCLSLGHLVAFASGVAEDLGLCDGPPVR